MAIEVTVFHDADGYGLRVNGKEYMRGETYQVIANVEHALKTGAGNTECDEVAQSIVADVHKRESEPTWENQLRAARKLPDSELRQHALVSTQNRHRCEDCFCCAALTVLEERHPQLTEANGARVLDAMEGN